MGFTIVSTFPFSIICPVDLLIVYLALFHWNHGFLVCLLEFVIIFTLCVTDIWLFSEFHTCERRESS